MKNTNIESIILPKKTIFQLISSRSKIIISDVKYLIINQKLNLKWNNGVLISKVIDGRFPDYNKVIPKDNDKF